jgi:MarR family transcriptional regulator, organic hydroperoxide resistance regulator
MARTSTKKDTAATAAALANQLRHFIAGVILYNQRVADQFGMHPTDMQTLHLLQLVGPMTPGRIADRTGLSTGGVTVLLDRLEQAGYVRRERNPDDRRSVVVHLNTARMAKVAEYYASIDEQLAEFLAAYPQRELETVVRFLTKINSIRPPAIQKLPDKDEKGSNT